MHKTAAMAHEAGMGAPSADHRFFDPKPPEQPEQILGVDTQAILRLGRAVTDLGVLPPSVNLGIYALPHAVRLVPLIEEMQSGAELKPEDVRPYRRPIKKLKPEAGFADKLAAGAGVIGLGVPIRRAINRRIEREFPKRAAEAIKEARETIAGIETIEDNVDYLSSFDNPREQFVSEVNDLAQTVSTAIYEHRDRRIHGEVHDEPKPEPPKGIKGFFVRAVRKIRGFFGIFRRQRGANREVTAYDASAGIESAMQTLMQDQDGTEQRLPMLSRLVFNRLPDNLPITRDKLAFVAPEILNFLFSTSASDGQHSGLMDSVRRNPHEFRFLTKLPFQSFRQYGRYSLEGIQSASHNLLPAIRDVLPTEGAKVREIFDQAQALLQPNHHQAEDATTSKSLRGRLKNLFHRRKPRK